MNQFSEEQEAARLEEFLTELRKNPAAQPSTQLDPQLAETARLSVAAEQAAVEPATWQLVETRDRVWQKSLANIEALNYRPAQPEQSRVEIPEKFSVTEWPSSTVSYLPPQPVNQAKKVNWPGLVLVGMAATVFITVSLFALVIIFGVAPRNDVTLVGSDPIPSNVVTTPVQVPPTMAPQPTAPAQTTANLAPQPTATSQPTPTPQPAYKVTVAVDTLSFTNIQIQATAVILENRLKDLGASNVKSSLNVDKITLEYGGKVDEDLVKKVVTNVGRIEVVDIGTEIVQIGDRLQTTFCTSGSILKPQANLCGQVIQGVAPTDPKVSRDGRSNTSTGSSFQTVLTGEDFDPTSLVLGVDQYKQNNLTFTLKPDAAIVMKNFTGSHIGKQLAITSDRGVMLAATIQGIIEDKGQITAQTMQDLKVVHAYIKSGPLPLSIQLVDFVRP